MKDLIRNAMNMIEDLTNQCQFITNMKTVPSNLQSTQGRERRRDLDIFKTLMINIRSALKYQLSNLDMTDWDTVRISLSQGQDALDSVESCISWSQEEADQAWIEHLEEQYGEPRPMDYQDFSSSYVPIVSPNQGHYNPNTGQSLVNVGTDSQPKWVTVEEYRLLADAKRS